MSEGKKMPRGLVFVPVGIAILAANCLSSFAADSRLAGYLLDRSCADNMKSQRMVPDDTHKKECALNQTCSRDGYAVYSKGQWYQLDKKGNELARHMLETTKTGEGHFVVVTGSLDKNEMKVSAIRELPKQP
jgi:hypothetical protein